MGQRVPLRTRSSRDVPERLPVRERVRQPRPWLLRILTGAVIAAGLVAVTVAAAMFATDLRGQPGWLIPAHVAMLAVAGAALVRVRVRAATAGLSWTDSATLICIVVLPPGWVGPVVLAGVFLGKLFGRVPPYKALYNASKDALSATAGLLVAIHFGLTASGNPLDRPLVLILVALTMTAVEFAVGLPVIAIVSQTPWHRVHRDDLDIKAAFFAGKLLVTVLAFLVLEDNTQLLALAPPTAVFLHLLVVGRLRARSEQATLARLATTTEQLGASDLDTVVVRAVADAVSLFAVERAEVFLRDAPGGPRLARGFGNGVVWSGHPDLAGPVPWSGLVVTAPLIGDDGAVGEVRLDLGARPGMTDRELLTLRTFASAVRTAVRNASAQAAADAKAALARRIDPLTGLANRAGLQEHGERVLAAPGPAALVTLGLDRLRDVNESLGHGAGDALLVEIARRLTTVAGPTDLVARVHGEVFAVMLGEVASSADARDRAAALLGCLAQPVQAGGVLVRVEATAGLAERFTEGEAAAIVELLRRAEVAMRQAKRGGPRVARYSPRRDPADVDTLVLGGELSRAIADGEFLVCFQPIVDLATGMMVAAEALTRWRHPQRGELDPLRFLDVVERSGLLLSFEEAVIGQALHAATRWRAMGVDAAVAVNVGPRSLLDPDYPRLVRGLLDRHGIAASDLVVELTESLTLDDLELADSALAQLRAEGVRLALDDFGTRSSPMAMVTLVPGVELKIDRSFVDGMDRSPESLAVVHSTVELGRTLGRVVVAEGVEREDQRRVLWEMGCPAGQGYLFARALPLEEFLALVREGVDGVVGQLARPLPERPGYALVDRVEPR